MYHRREHRESPSHMARNESQKHIAATKHRLRLVRTHTKAQIATSVSSVSNVSPRLSRPKAKGSGTCSHWEIPGMPKETWPMDLKSNSIIKNIGGSLHVLQLHAELVTCCHNQPLQNFILN